jgi:two-component sensor histidine kinase
MLTSIEGESAPLASDGAWLLLAELNHRIGNELQAALSALRLARRGLSGEDPERFIEEAAARIQCFGDVHQLLDRQRPQGPLAQRLEALCRATSLSKAAPLGIHLMLKLEDVVTDDETAWTLCVVASEFMTNAFKHGFPGGLPGVVCVGLRQDQEGVLLTVIDTGIGAAGRRRPIEAVWQAPGFGSGIVTQLAERLGGFVTRVSGADGTTATFRVPAARLTQ